MLKNGKKPSLCGVLCLFAVLLFASVIILGSCSNDYSEDSGPSGTADLTLDVNTPASVEEKSLTVSINNNISSGGTDAYYWGYKAIKQDSYGKTGERTSVAALKSGETGIAGISNLSVGKWKIQLLAYNNADLADSHIVYRSTMTDVNIKANSVNRIVISVKRVQDAAANGTLTIIPSEITLAENPRASWGIDSVTGIGTEDENIIRTPFGKLSEYAYEISLYTKNDYSTGKTVVVANKTALQASEDTTPVVKTLAPGRYFVKIEIYRNTSAELATSRAETYLAMFPVDIYSNSVTTIKNNSSDGDKAGLDVKEVKQFKITYKTWNNTPSGEDWVSDAEHSAVNSDILDENGQVIWENYPKIHQYGRSEYLDEPTREGYGFAGYYLTGNGTDDMVLNVPAWTYQDFTLYAKWDVKRYASITYNDNFPAKAEVTTSTDTTGASESTANDSLEPVMPLSNPEAKGYIFKGWTIDSSHSRLNRLPAAWKADIDAVCVAEWEPVHYRVKYNLNLPAGKTTSDVLNLSSEYQGVASIVDVFSEINGGDMTAGTAGGVGTDKMKYAEYDVSDKIADCMSNTIGFLGWSLSPTYVDENSIVGLDGTVMNLSASDGATVTLYALWSDYFKPLEYIRSVSSAASAGQVIDTGLVTGTGSGNVARCVMEMELSGGLAAGQTREIPFGENKTPWSFIVDTFYRDGYWKIERGSFFGQYFEDEKYKLDLYGDGSVITLKIDDEILTQGNWGFAGGSFYLFNFSPTGNAMTNMRLYSCSIYNLSGNVLRRFQPCILTKALTSSDADKARNSQPGNTYPVGTIGLWDLKTNKFYPNMGSGRFYQPSEEVVITYYSNRDNSDTESRTQKVISGMPEALHRNLFSKSGSTFKYWGSAGNSETGLDNQAVVTLTKNTSYYAIWSVPTSYNLFGQVDWLYNVDGAFIDLGVVSNGQTEYVIDIRIPQQNEAWFPQGNKLGRFFGNAPNGQLLCMNFDPDYKWGVTYNRITGYVDNSSASYNKSFYYDAERDSRHSVAIKTDGFYVDGSKIGSWDSSKYTGDSYTALLFAWEERRASTVSGGGGPKYNGYCAPFKWKNPSGVETARQVAYGGRYYVYSMSMNKDGKEIHRYVPAVLNVDLTSSNTITDATGASIPGNKKVFGEINCYKGEAGMWDLNSDMFYPNMNRHEFRSFDDSSLGLNSRFDYPTDTFTIRYDSNGGLGLMEPQVISSSASGFKGARLNGCRFERNDYEFIGWNTMPDGSGDWYSPERTVRKTELKNVTLFAQWRPIPKNVPYLQLTYLQNEGSPRRNAAGIIDTGIKRGSYGNPDFRCVVEYNKLDTNQAHVMGANGDESSGNTFTIYKGAIRPMYGSTSYSFTENVKTKYTVDMMSFNDMFDVSVTAEGGSRQDLVIGGARNGRMVNYNVALFGFNTSDNGKGYANDYDAYGDNAGSRIRIYSFKFYGSNEALARDFIPVILMQDIPATSASDRFVHKKGELGMWDKSNSGLNNGDGVFYGQANKLGGYFSNDELCIIRFNANGGSGVMDNQSFILDGEAHALNRNAFTKARSKFIGWNTKADGTGVWYHDKYESSAWKGGIITMYAQWDSLENLLSTAYFEPVNYVNVKGQAFLNTRLQGNTAIDITMYLRFDRFESFIFGSRKDTGPNASYCTFVYYDSSVGKCRVRIDAVGAGNASTQEGIDMNNTDVYKIRRWFDTANKVSVNDTVLTGSTSVQANNGYDMYLFHNHSVGNRNSNLALNIYRFEGDCYNVEIIHPDGDHMRLIPCRLIKKITSYEAGSITGDTRTHNNGEVGFWDIVNNKFYGNDASFGSFTCEFDK